MNRIVGLMCGAMLLLGSWAVAVPAGAASRAAAVWTPPAGAQVTPKPCHDDPTFLCGSVRVPIDRAHPSHGTLDITFNIIPRRDPDFHRDRRGVRRGGRSRSGHHIEANRNAYPVLSPAIERDIVLIDVRGTGPTAIRCPRFQHGRFHPSQLLEDRRHVRRAPGPRRGPLRDRRCGHGHRGRPRALGYPTIDMVMGSAAGVLEQAYAVRYPHRVRSIVSDATYPVTAHARVGRGTRAAGPLCPCGDARLPTSTFLRGCASRPWSPVLMVGASCRSTSRGGRCPRSLEPSAPRRGRRHGVSSHRRRLRNEPRRTDRRGSGAARRRPRAAPPPGCGCGPRSSTTRIDGNPVVRFRWRLRGGDLQRRRHALAALVVHRSSGTRLSSLLRLTPRRRIRAVVGAGWELSQSQPLHPLAGTRPLHPGRASRRRVPEHPNPCAERGLRHRRPDVLVPDRGRRVPQLDARERRRHGTYPVGLDLRLCGADRDQVRGDASRRGHDVRLSPRLRVAGDPSFPVHARDAEEARKIPGGTDHSTAGDRRVGDGRHAGVLDGSHPQLPAAGPDDRTWAAGRNASVSGLSRRAAREAHLQRGAVRGRRRDLGQHLVDQRFRQARG